MLMLPTLKHFLFATILLVATGGFATIVVYAQKTGFINIDCGLPPQDSYYAENYTELFYLSDSGFIDTGDNKFIPKNEKTENFQKQMFTLRSFPKGTRNCYRINVTSRNKYLIQASFLYANYDDTNTLPIFDLHLGTDLWDTIDITHKYYAEVREIIHVPLRNYIHICLVKTGSSTPFISEIELRPLKHTIYNQTLPGSLALVERWDIGSTTDKRVGSPIDDLARDWYPYTPENWQSLSANYTIGPRDDEYQVPSVVMETAARPQDGENSLDFSLPDDDDTSQYYVFMHFAEVEYLEHSDTREFQIYFGVDVESILVSPMYLETTTRFNDRPLKGAEIISINATQRSTLPPIINAYEVYFLKHFSESQVDQNDGDAIRILKSTYGVTRNWQGDPCAPNLYLWEGVICFYFGDNEDPRIISLNLSSSGLTGGIPPSISNLTMIQKLDLSNNKFTGAVPDFLAHLPNLTFLNLENNILTGLVPVHLIEKRKNNALTLRVCGNRDLVTTAPIVCPQKKKKNLFNILIVVSGVGIFVLLIIITAAIWWGVQRKRKHSIASTIQNGSLESKNQQFTRADILKITNNFERVIGEGGFGTVYHGHIGDTQVAVKVLSPTAVQGHQQFLAEVNLLLRVHHRSLTTLVGYCNDGTNACLIYEYMASGNLKALISDDRSCNLKWEARIEIALQAAQGLEYLHYGCKPPIIHRDVKCTNILINEKLQAKLSDFGLSRTLSTDSSTASHISTVVAGTPGYLDPHYNISNRLNEKSDVYSFGVVLLEIITGRPPIRKSQRNTSIHISQWVTSMIENGDIKSIVDPMLQGNFDVHSAWKAVELAINCVSTETTLRPTMSQVVNNLKECLNEALAATKESHGIEYYSTETYSSETRPLYSNTQLSLSPR